MLQKDKSVKTQEVEEGKAPQKTNPTKKLLEDTTSEEEDGNTERDGHQRDN